MIGKLTGVLDSSGPDHAIVDVNGVGYVVLCAARTLANLPPAGEAVRLMIETQVREDSITLFGFADAAERNWFRLLLNIQGVGARLALAVLSACPPDELVRAVAAQDKAPLTRAAGVGPKLAARIVRELTDKIATLPGLVAGAPGAASPVPPSGGPLDDALSALVNLGYGRSEAFAALQRAEGEAGKAAGVDQLIRLGLRELSAG